MNCIKDCESFEQFKYTVPRIVNKVNDCVLRRICESMNKFSKVY